jgi:putative FmdB family regulatory protein
MPIYEYVCRECGERFEKLVRAWGETVACPRCEAESVDKQVSSFAFAGAGGGSGRSSGGGGCGCGRGGCGCGH